MEDYTGNSKRAKEEKQEPKEEKVVEKVISGEVVVQKKSIRRRFKDIFAEADVKSVTSYVTRDVLIPAMLNMFVDSVSKGAERMAYGESTSRRRSSGYSGPRVTYNSSPLHRGPREVGPGPRPRFEPRHSRRAQGDYILANRDEADLVLERLNDIIDTYGVASVADLHDLIGETTTHVDNKWGWVYLGDTQIRQIREGWLLDLPPADPIN